MTTTDLRAEIMQMIKEEEDASILEAIRTLLRKVRYIVAEDDDLTDAEVAELEERYQEIITGKVKPHTIEESMRIARGGLEGDA